MWGWGEESCGFSLRSAAGRRQGGDGGGGEWRAQSTPGWRRGKAKDAASRLVTVTAGGAGTEGADSLGEMAGDGRRRVLGALHLLLLAALPLATEGISRGAAGWTQEKVRDCCCAMVPGRLLPGAGTWGRASPPRQRGRRGGAAVPAPAAVPLRAPRGAGALRPRRGASLASGTPRELDEVTGLPSAGSDAAADRRRKCVWPVAARREVGAHGRAASHSGPTRPTLSHRCIPGHPGDADVSM